MMTGNGVMHNGTTILDEYGHNLDRLKVSEFFYYSVTPYLFTNHPIPPPLPSTTLLSFFFAVIFSPPCLHTGR